MTKPKGQDTRQSKRRKTDEEEAIDKETGDRIRKVRTEEAKMDQKTFAARLGVTPSAVNQWESGLGCNRFNLDKIAATFGISQPWLNRGKGNRHTERVVERLFMLPPEDIESIEEWVDFKWEKWEAEKALKQANAPVKERGGNSNEARRRRPGH